MKIKSIAIPLLIILAISLSANIYSFKKLGDENTSINEKDVNENDVSGIEKEMNYQGESNDNQNEKLTNESSNLGDSDNKNLKNSAERYIEFAFNVSPENYATAKSNADKYMTEDMVDLLFASNGIDPDFKMKVDNIKIYETTNEKDFAEVVAFYTTEIETYETKEVGELRKTNLVERNENYVLIQFKKVDGELKVYNFMPLSIKNIDTSE